MASTYSNRTKNLVNDYANIRTIPAMMSVIFALASLYQFGGISDVTLAWIGGSGGYTLTGEHAVIASMGAYVVAFMSSETKQFEHYANWEKVAIVLAPAVILGQQYVTEVNDFLTSLGDPLGMQLAFFVTIVAWGVAVQ